MAATNHVRLTRAKHGIHTWHSTTDGRFTIKPTQWAPGNPHRPTGFELIDRNNPRERHSASRLEEGRHLIAVILEQEAMRPRPNKVIVSLTCDTVTGQADVEMWLGKNLAPEIIVANYTGTTGQKSWDVEVLVHGRGRQANGTLTKTVYTRTWNRSADGDSIVYADDWVRDWVAENEPTADLIP